MAFVLDASIAIAWVVPSQATPYTRRIRLQAKREPYHVPAIYAAEVTNVLVTLQRRGILSEQGAEAAADVLRRLNPIVHPMSLGISELRDLANRFGSLLRMRVISRLRSIYACRLPAVIAR